jgi:hypothetical protein
MKIPDLKEDDVILLEKEIDRMNEVLPEMKNFIYRVDILQYLTTYCPLYLQKGGTLLCQITGKPGRKFYYN